MNQPLAALMANGQAALRMIGRPRPQLDELRATLDDMVSDSRRAGDVIRQLRSFARKEPPAQAPIDVNETAREVVRLLEGDAQGRRIWLEVHLDPELPSVVGDRVQLQQVMLNLLMNAFDAVESREVGGRRVILRSQRESDRVTLSVADHGAGVSDEHLSRLFEPFFTTKPEGKGLGLSISSAIVSEHGGVLRSERNPERGMTFSFSLPLPPGRELSAAERQVAAGRMR
jgi:two-component system sensor kinase FixL